MAQSASSGGQGAGNNRYVKFTRQAGQRIAKAVQAVEDGNRDQGPLAFGFRGVGVSGKVFRVATFTGAWNKNALKTVTLRTVTTTPNTVSANNIFANMTATGTRNCAIAKDGTAWYLIAAEC